MLPSPSLGPPWLSASASPALGPCGIPFLVEPEVELAPDEDVVAAAPPEDVEAGAEDELVELEEFEPQAATAMATSTSARGASRRIDRMFSDFMDLLLEVGRAPAPTVQTLAVAQ